MKSLTVHAFSWILIGALLSCGDSAGGDDVAGDTGGGSQGSGGATPSEGSQTATGGSTVGGSAGKGGATAAGGAVNTGGARNSGGSTNVGGTPNTGGTASSDADAGDNPDVTHVIGNCGSLPAVGVWEEVTPAAVRAQIGSSLAGSLSAPASPHEYGTQALSVDPLNPTTVYFGTEAMGIWKTTDCGSTWAHINTGRNGSALDTGMQWSVEVDSVDSQVVYANTGYGAQSNGVWKSTNGGKDWDAFWPPTDPTLKNIVDYNFVHKIRIDPNDHQHLLISFHAACEAPYNHTCIAETKDAGQSWKLVNGLASWVGGEDQTVWILNDAKTWLWSSQSNGMWRTSDEGATWTSVGPTWGGHNGGQLYRARGGAFYLSGPAGLLRSPDGVSWTLDPNLGNGLIGITGDGTTMYLSHGPYPQDPPYLPYFSSSEGDGQHWTQMTSPKMGTGGYELGYDPDHHILYSSNFSVGFWRVVTR